MNNLLDFGVFLEILGGMYWCQTFCFLSECVYRSFSPNFFLRFILFCRCRFFYSLVASEGAAPGEGAYEWLCWHWHILEESGFLKKLYLLKHVRCWYHEIIKLWPKSPVCPDWIHYPSQFWDPSGVPPNPWAGWCILCYWMSMPLRASRSPPGLRCPLV